MAAKKWSHLKGKVPKFEAEEKWQQKINVVKVSLTEKKKTDLAAEFTRLKAEKEELEARITDINTSLEAISQLVTERLEDEGITKFELNNGDLYYLQDEPYCQLENKELFVKWLKANKMEELLTVYHQSLNSLVKDALVEGRLVPPGVKIFLKTSLRQRSAKNTKEE